jgi:hypothetical protein
MPARAPSEPDRDGGTTGGAGRFGPRAYTDWRASTLGAITEDLERRLVFELAGEIRAALFSMSAAATGRLRWRSGNAVRSGLPAATPICR